MSTFNIYMCGVGGQGIGVLSEVMAQACLLAGHHVRGVDTHGLAQRGGIVVSHLRLGEQALTPRVPPGTADVVLALERLEALRATSSYLKPGGTVAYYDTEMQPIHVRLGLAEYPSAEDVERVAAQHNATVLRVFVDDLPDPRMQNTALLAKVTAAELVASVDRECMEQVLRNVLSPNALEANLEVFNNVVSVRG